MNQSSSGTETSGTTLFSDGSTTTPIPAPRFILSTTPAPTPIPASTSSPAPKKRRAQKVPSLLAYRTYQRNPGWVSLPARVLDYSRGRRRNGLSLQISTDLQLEPPLGPVEIWLDSQVGSPDSTHSYRSPTREIQSESSSSTPSTILPITPIPVNNYNHNMANMMMPGLIKPVPFSGERGVTPVSEFLDTLELAFMVMETSLPADKMARARLLTFQNLLEGKAKQWWNYHAKPEQKITYETASTALRARFPVAEMGQPEELGKAMTAFNVLKQNGRSVDEYIEHVNELAGILGNDFQALLAMWFVDGIENEATRQAVDAQVEEPYTLNSVVIAYRKATKSIRRLESYQEKKTVIPTETRRTEDILREDPIREMIRNQERLAAMYIDSQAKLMQKVSEVGQTVGVQNSMNAIARATPAGERYPTGYGMSSAWTPTCVKCGKKRHMSRDCLNPPLAPEEQRKLREKYLRPAQPGQPGVAGVAVIEELTTEELGITGNNDPLGTMTMSVTMIEELTRDDTQSPVKESQVRDVGYLGTQFLQMFAALSVDNQRALLNAAAADTRSRDEIESAGVTQQQGPDQQRIRLERGSIGVRSAAAGPSRPSPRPPPVVEDPVEAEDSQTPPPNPEQNWQPFVPDPKYAAPEYVRRFLAQNPDFMASASKKKGKKGAGKNDNIPKPKKVIRLMSGQKPWDAMESLRNTPVSGLTWGNFLALAPSVKAKLGKGLILEKVPERSNISHVGVETPVGVNVAIPQDRKKASDVALVRGGNSGFLYGDAIPEPMGTIVNFYTTGRITNQREGELITFQVPQILIDGGAVVNLMPESVVRRLGLPCEDNNDVVIRTATNELYPILKRTRFNINVADVLAEILVYVVRQPLGYSLILGRRWMQQVRAFGDYRTHAYVIFDQWDKPHCVPVSPQCDDQVIEHKRVGIPDVISNPTKSREQMELTDTEFEELSMDRNQRDTLLNQVIREARNELADWEEEGLSSEEEEGEELESSDEEESERARLIFPGTPRMMGKGGKC